MIKEQIIFSSDSGGFTREDLEVTSKISEDYFGTKKDPEQFPVCSESKEWMFTHQQCLNIMKSKGVPVGYSLMFPATTKLMNDFCDKEITEAELFESIKKFKQKPDALYLCASIVEEKFRKQGLATTGFVKLIKNMVSQIKYCPVLFYWEYSEEGKKLAEKVAKITCLQLRARD
ncbi:MAG: hypothetical protein Q7K43_05050 [Candidatus Woesearchaeota archaeon]|nr:hypothetical protein [Candidatus Woesearchaeota archaeon]